MLHQILAAKRVFQQSGMCDQQRLRPACAYAQSNQSRIFYDCQATDRISCEVSNVKARRRLHISKCHIVGIHMSRLKCRLKTSIGNISLIDFQGVGNIISFAACFCHLLIIFGNRLSPEQLVKN